MVPQFDQALKDAAHINSDIRPRGESTTNVDAIRVCQLNASSQKLRGQPTLIEPLNLRTLRLAVHPLNTIWINPDTDHRHAILGCHGQQIRQVVLALGVVILELTDPVSELHRWHRHDAGVDLLDLTLWRCRILFLYTAHDAALCVSQDAPIASRVSQLSGQDRDAPVLLTAGE